VSRASTETTDYRFLKPVQLYLRGNGESVATRSAVLLSHYKGIFDSSESNCFKSMRDEINGL